MSILITALVNFISLWILVSLFDSGIDNKMRRIIVLTIVMVAVSIIGNLLGGIGIFIASIVNIIAIMKFLGYDFLTAFLFSMGLGILQYFVIFGLFYRR